MITTSLNTKILVQMVDEVFIRLGVGVLISVLSDSVEWRRYIDSPCPEMSDLI